MQDLKQLMRDHYLRYASYVILDRAIPDIVDGLKPVQRRILYTLYRMHDGKFHKVANVSGQTMPLHPHGEAPIYEAIVNIANKGYLLDCQGNFGNIYTGDPAAAARYIETRLSPLALETLFANHLTQFVPSYDGRNQEPVLLPAKIPLLLMQGAEGIAVGMATKIFPHNFVELLEAEIAILEGTTKEIYPDFPTGGIVDVSDYRQGRGKIRLRAKIEVKDQKTLVIREICAGTTTDSVVQSIDDAVRKGKLKVDSIHDYTAEKVEIEIKLPRGQYAEEVQELLYAYTECQVSLTSQMVLIQDGLPVETDVQSVLTFHAEQLRNCLKLDLEYELGKLAQVVFERSLERIFIDEKIYKEIEDVEEQNAVYDVLKDAFSPYQSLLSRVPGVEDFDRLLAIPIRRIARFDRKKNEEEIARSEKKMGQIRKQLKTMTAFTIDYLRDLLKRYGALYPRKTQINTIEEINKKEIERKEITVYFDKKTEYVGIKISGAQEITCTNYDKLILFYKSGMYKVINIPEKQYIGFDNDEVVFVGIADKQTVCSVLFRDPKSGFSYAKRFIIKQYILDKTYRYIDEEMEMQYFTVQPDVQLLLHLLPKARQKVSLLSCSFKGVGIKGVSAHGIRVSNRFVLQVEEQAQALN